MDFISNTQLFFNATPLAMDGLKTLSFLLITYFILKIIQYRLSKTIFKSDNTAYKLKQTLKLVFIVVCLLAGFSFYVDNPRNIGIVLGLATAGLAFALQEFIASFVASFIIVFTRYYSSGDRIVLNGIVGDVIQIGFLKTTMMECGEWIKGDLYTGRIVKQMNNSIFKCPVHNYSEDFPFLWDEIEVPINLESDINKSEKLFLDVTNSVVEDFVEDSKRAWKNILKEYYISKASIVPSISMRFDENWITFTIRYIVSYKSRRTTKSELSKRLLTVIKNEEDIILANSSLEVSYTQKAVK